MQVILNVLPLAAVTPLSLLAAFTWLVLRGKLVPRSWVDKSDADQAAEIAWLRQTNSEQAVTIGSQANQIAELTVQGRLSVALLQSLNAPSGNHAITDPGSDHVAPSIED